MLTLYQGNPIIEWYYTTASTTMLNGGVVQLSSGQLILATATSTLHLGIIMRDFTSTAVQADYTSSVKVPVLIPDEETIFIADVKLGTAAFTSSVVGTQCQLYIGTGSESAPNTMNASDCYVDPNATSHLQVTIVGYISQTKILVKLNSNILYKNAS